MNREDENKVQVQLIDLGAASQETKAMTFGADDSKGGLWIPAGLTLD